MSINTIFLLDAFIFFIKSQFEGTLREPQHKDFCSVRPAAVIHSLKILLNARFYGARNLAACSSYNLAIVQQPGQLRLTASGDQLRIRPTGKIVLWHCKLHTPVSFKEERYAGSSKYSCAG